MTYERDVERYFTEQVKAIGGYSRKLKWIGVSGAPDRVVFFPWGIPQWVEIKRLGGQPNGRQPREFDTMAAHNAPVTVINSLERVDAWITMQRALRDCATPGG